MDQILNAVNSSLAGATIAAGVLIKYLIGDKKIGKVSLKKFLPLFILIVGELLNILYGITTKQNIVISVSNGLISTLLATYGYDFYKAVHKKGTTNIEDGDVNQA